MRSEEEFVTDLSIFLTATETDSDCKEEDRLLIEGHKPSGARLLSNCREVLCISITTSRTGVVDLEDGEEGVEGLGNGDEGTEDLNEGVAGLLLSADWDLFGCEIPDMVEAQPVLGDGLRLGVVGVEREVDEVADLYLEAISLVRSLRVAGAALLFSEGTNGGLTVSSI